MSGDYGYAADDAQTQHLRRILKQHGYNDEVVDTVIARNTEAAAANAAPHHNQTLARPSRSTPAPSVESIFYISRRISAVVADSDSEDDGGFGADDNADTAASGEDGRSCDEPRDSSLVGCGGGEAKTAAQQQPQNNPELSPETKFLDVSVWLEAVDPKHRYSKSLKKYFCFWQQQQQLHDNSEDHEDFFTWLDFGGGRSVDLPWCPRRVLEGRRVKYMTPLERSYFEVLVKGGVLRWKSTDEPCYTRVGWLQRIFTKKIVRSGTWIFVLSHDGRLFVGQKVKGRLHHSSFMAGAPTLASGNIHIGVGGKLKVISPKSGHYRPVVSVWCAALKEFFIAGGIKDGGESAFRL